jgi:hypothetical protein
MRKQPFLWALLAGVATAVLIATFPSIPKAPGVRSPIVELEFARSVAEVATITGNYDAAITEAFRSNIAHDRWFILAYTGFLALSCASAWRIRRHYWLIAGVGLAVAAGIFDHIENSALLNLLDSNNSRPEQHLAELHRFTWLKWGSIVAVFLCLATFQWYSGRVGRGMTVFAILTAFAAMSAWFNPAAVLPFTGLISFEFLLLYIWCATYKSS